MTSCDHRKALIWLTEEALAGRVSYGAARQLLPAAPGMQLVPLMRAILFIDAHPLIEGRGVRWTRGSQDSTSSNMAALDSGGLATGSARPSMCWRSPASACWVPLGGLNLPFLDRWFGARAPATTSPSCTGRGPMAQAGLDCIYSQWVMTRPAALCDDDVDS